MIYTFYSYKGGVGRTMALANVAELLYQSGLTVLMVDWDLEAPGLERFFPVDLEKVLEKRGVMDLILNYKSQMANDSTISEQDELPFEKPDALAVDIYPDSSNKGKLLLLTAGRRSQGYFSEYANDVLAFDWQDFYENWAGETYFEWLSQQFQSIADVVLIDSRTGLNEMSGVCTYQFADVVVMFCASNKQNMEGTYELARSFKRSEIKEARHGRPIEILIVPSRVEDRAETEYLNDFHDDFVSKFNKFVPKALGQNAESFWKLKIPYVPYYAFKELVSVREIGKASSEDLIRAFYSLASAMAIFDQSLNKALQGIYNELYARKEKINPISVIVPAFNESATIGSVILSASRYADRVIVIDDGSSDRTAEIAERMAETTGVEVIRHLFKRGKGAALKTGFDAIREGEIIVTLDANGQHDPADIPKLIEPILSGEAEMVIGSRYLKGNKKETPFYRHIGQMVLDKATNLESGLDITDSQSGFRAFASHTKNLFRFMQNGYAIDSEMLVDAENAGLRIKEVEISVRPVVEISSENPISRGFRVFIESLRVDMFSRRPLYYFTLPGMLFAISGIIVGLEQLRIFYHGGSLSYGPTLIMIMMIMIGTFTALIGIILNALENLINRAETIQNSKKLITNPQER